MIVAQPNSHEARRAEAGRAVEEILTRGGFGGRAFPSRLAFLRPGFHQSLREGRPPMRRDNESINRTRHRDI